MDPWPIEVTLVKSQMEIKKFITKSSEDNLSGKELSKEIVF